MTLLPSEVIPTPTSKRSLRSCQPKILGPRIATLGWRSAASNSCSRAVESGALSSCNSQTHSIVSAGRESAAKSGRGTKASPASTHAPKPGFSVRATTRSGPKLRVKISRDASDELASTPTMTSGGREVLANWVRTAGSHVSPLWETSTVLTKWERVSTSSLSDSSSNSKLTSWSNHGESESISDSGSIRDSLTSTLYVAHPRERATHCWGVAVRLRVEGLRNSKFLESAALTFGEPTPNAETFILLKCVFQAINAYFT